jgi:RNA polymerase sigma factor (sigma-70 family)
MPSTALLAMLPDHPTLNAEPDVVALARLRAGDRAAGAGVWERHADICWRVALRICGQPADAEDALQEVAIALLTHPPVRCGSTGLRGWLVAATANAARNAVRSRQRRQRREQPVLATHAGPEDLPEHALAERLHAALAALPDTYRLPVVLRCVDRLEFPVVADACGLGVRTARTRVARGLARLRAALGVGSPGTCGIALALVHDPAAALPAAPAHLAASLARPNMPAAPAATATATATAVLVGGGVVVGSVLLAVAFSSTAGGDAPTRRQGEAPPPPAPVQAQANPTFAGRTRMLLPNTPIDFWFAVDFDALGTASTTKPGSGLTDPRLKQLRKLLEEQLDSSLQGLKSSDATAGGLRAAALSDGGLAFWGKTNVTGGGACAVTPGADGRRFWTPKDEASSRVEGILQPMEKGFTVPDDVSSLLADTKSRRKAAQAIVKASQQAKPAIVVQVPAHPVAMQADFGGVIARYAQLDTDRSDPCQVGSFLGPDWRNFRPILTAEAWLAADGWHTSSDLRRFMPMSPIILPVEDAFMRLFRSLGQLRPVAPGIRLPRLAGDLLRVDVGCAGDLKAAGAILDGRLGRLLAGLSGDLSLRLRPGAPFPGIDCAIGLKPGSDAARWLQDAVAAAGLTGTSAPDGTLIVTPAGVITATATPGLVRLRMAVAEAAPVPPGAPPVGFDVEADVDRLAQVVLPIAALMGWSQDPLFREAATHADALAAHLGTYELHWRSTADGFHADERGLPLLPCLAAWSAANYAWLADPDRETADAQEVMQYQQLAERHGAAIAVLRRLTCKQEDRTWTDLLDRAGVAPEVLAKALGRPGETPWRTIASQRWQARDADQPRTQWIFSHDKGRFQLFVVPLGKEGWLALSANAPGAVLIGIGAPPQDQAEGAAPAPAIPTSNF